jgi:hypothetical protein
MASQEMEKKYQSVAWRFFLPYRLFLDDGIYNVNMYEKRWNVCFLTHEKENFRFYEGFNFINIARSQIEFDRYGHSGLTEVKVIVPFDEEKNYDEVFTLIEKKVEPYCIKSVLNIINHIISLYKAKTNEHWFNLLTEYDLCTYMIGLMVAGSINVENYCRRGADGMSIASVGPFLKSEEWYEDLFFRLNSGWNLPLFLELILEGKDALSRGNYRLASTNFICALENIFRSLIRECFPTSNMETKPVIQMLHYYYNNYPEIAPLGSLPFRKNEAKKLYKKLWNNRDKIMHGHDLDISKQETIDAANAVEQFYLLWTKRPGARSELVVEGVFSGVEPSRDPNVWVQRAAMRFQDSNGSSRSHLQDSKEAALYALMLKHDHSGALEILFRIKGVAPDLFEG